MSRVVLWMKALAILAFLTGCRMCAHPYDYAGPVYHQGCGYNAMPGARLGSILEGGSQEMPIEAAVEQEAAAPSTYSPSGDVHPREGDIVGAPRILSVTDRALSETASEVAEKSFPNMDYSSGKTESGAAAVLSAQGWRARRAQGEVLR